MNLFSIGISHHTAPVDVRENMYVSADELPRALAQLKERLFSECMLVSTCNRTELYGILQDPSVADREIIAALLTVKGAAETVHPDHFTSHHAGAALHHLLRAP